MSTYLLAKTVIKQIDKFRKYYLWHGSDINNKKPPKVAWTLVCDTTENGGLGVINLQTHIQCLLLKNLHKFYNRMDIPWVQLVWGRSDSQMVDLQQEPAKVPLGGVMFRSCYLPSKV